MTERIRLIVGMLAVVVLVAGAAVLQRAREVRFPRPPVSEESLYVTSGTTARRLALGYSALAADLYWIRTIQYYGGVKLRLERDGPRPASADGTLPSDYALLHPLLDLTTTLDPAFNIAYRFGAIFLAEPYPGGAGRPDLAIALLQKGLAARPDKWEYMQDIGFVHYWWRHDYRAAAEWFDKASALPGAPWFLRSLAATTLAEGGDRESSRTMWQAIYQSAEIEWLRNDAERRLLQLDAMDFIDQVQRVVNQARAAGVAATDWQALIRAGVIRRIPADATLTPLELDGSGRVRLSRQSPLFPLPEEPQRAFAPQS
jgi:tetratricopeptide (TPR) repeat protein